LRKLSTFGILAKSDRSQPFENFVMMSIVASRRQKGELKVSTRMLIDVPAPKLASSCLFLL
jgi:hypothetical protein